MCDEEATRKSVVVQTPDLVHMCQVNYLTNLIAKEAMIRIRLMWDWDAPLNRFYIPTVDDDLESSLHGNGLYMPLDMDPKRDGADLYVMDFLFVAMSAKIKPIVHECVSKFKLREAIVTAA
ncbi:MAG: hypothetical protein NTV39_04540 [Candidatus Saccharibacteria bacterium]|nr:hypothetical protein [Candidatus Saccharibacteria bacterium]